jgi:hypothetical protein
MPPGPAAAVPWPLHVDSRRASGRTTFGVPGVEGGVHRLAVNCYAPPVPLPAALFVLVACRQKVAITAAELCLCVRDVSLEHAAVPRNVDQLLRVAIPWWLGSKYRKWGDSSQYFV